MARGFKRYNETLGLDVVYFYCPGCETYHSINANKEPGGPAWDWNGDLDKITISPSILVNKDRPERRCHSFVRNGQFQYLNDCFHDLKGQTVDIPEEDEEEDE